MHIYLFILKHSEVFGPSNLCFNAVSYLIDTAQAYSKIFAGLGDLFERISAFLDRFDVYARGKSQGIEPDLHLKEIIHKLLRSFMRICGLSVEVSNKFKPQLWLEVFLFRTDKGIQQESDALESLISQEIGMSIALILEKSNIIELKVTTGFAEVKRDMKTFGVKMDDVSGAIGGMTGMLTRQENTEKIKEQETSKDKNKLKIKETLKIDSTKETWRSDYEECIKNRVAHTGGWLTQDPSFSAWASLQANARPIFYLEAKEGYGKSYLSTAVVRHLEELYPLGRQDPRVSVAYYFFEKDEEEKNPVNKALKALIWQLTLNDELYQKSVAGLCNNPSDFVETLNMWRLLFRNFLNTSATFFLVLDGIEQAAAEHGNPLVHILRDILEMAESHCQLCIRIFLTGRPNGLEEMEGIMDISVARVNLGVRNEDDIQKYIEDKMNHMEILKRTGQSEIQALRSQILTALVQGVQGDFIKLNYKLSEINTKRRKKEIEDVLEYAGEDRQDTITRAIEQLDKRLGQEDIQDLNELLTWVLGHGYPLLSELEELLLLKNGEPSLVPLEEQIQSKFSDLLQVSEDDVVTLRSDSIKDYLRTKSKAAEDISSGSSAALHPSEVAIVRRFLQSVCDDDLFQKFGFEDFFKRKLTKRGMIIHVNMENLPIGMVTTCLEAICQGQVKSVEALIDSAFLALPRFLRTVDLALADADPKRRIGAILIKLFTNDEYISRWWTEKRSWMRLIWLYDDENVNTVLTWFKDSAVSRDLTKDMKEWINKLTSNSNPDEDLLRPTTLFMAKRWLQSPSEETYGFLWWLLGYITKVRAPAHYQL